MDTRTKQQRMQALGDLMQTMMDDEARDTAKCSECDGHPATGATRFGDLCEFCGFVAGCDQ